MQIMSKVFTMSYMYIYISVLKFGDFTYCCVCAYYSTYRNKQNSMLIKQMYICIHTFKTCRTLWCNHV